MSPIHIRPWLLLLFATVASMALAQVVTPEKARDRAADFMAQKGMKPAALTCVPIGADTLGGDAPLYVFHDKEQQGFVIIAGDERSQSVLGYAEEGTFDFDGMPANMKAWLRGYADEIRSMRRQSAVNTLRNASGRSAIRPLLTTRWGQGVPSKSSSAYNMQCPTIDQVYCLTGCVATALAQVMNYYRWPETTSVEIPRYTPNSSVGELAALPVTSFDWDHMADKYKGSETDEQRTAVAQLMRYCGQAVSMDYGTASSGAITSDTPKALKNYFGYDTNTRFVQRSDYSAEGWDQLIYTELSEGRPVIYKGVSSEYGHSFVCDGCDDSGLYHINWGADGRYNGYFALSVLNPYGPGEGYTGTADGFAMSQGAVVGIQPDNGDGRDDRALHVEYITYYSHNLYALFVNETGAQGTFEYGFQYHKVGDSEYKQKKTTGTFKSWVQKTFYFDVTTLKLANGVYRFYPYSRLSGNPDYSVNGNYLMYLEVTISDGAVKSITIHPTAKLAISKIECTGNKVVGMTQEMKVTLSNTGEEYNGPLYLFASKNTIKGEYVNKTAIVVGAASTAEARLYFTPTSTGTWYLWADTDENGAGIAKRVRITVRSLPTQATNLQLVDCVVEALPQETTVTVKVKNNGKDGYFMPLRCMLYSYTDGKYTGFAETPNMNIAMSGTVETQFTFDDLEFGRKYYAALYYYVSHTSNEIKRLGDAYDFTVDLSGLLGDVNNDGVVDISDVLQTVDYVLGKEVTLVVRAADCNADGTVDISDVLSIVDLVLGKSRLRYY